jgi:hypothetical protein
MEWASFGSSSSLAASGHLRRALSIYASNHADRLFQQDVGPSAFNRTCALKAGERPIERLARQAEVTRDILKLTLQIHGTSVRSGAGIEVEHHPVFGGANLHEFKALPQLYDLMRYVRQEGHGTCRIAAKSVQYRGLRIYAHPGGLRRHGVAMEGVGKERRFDEELARGSATEE